MKLNNEWEVKSASTRNYFYALLYHTPCYISNIIKETHRYYPGTVLDNITGGCNCSTCGKVPPDDILETIDRYIKIGKLANLDI